MAITPFSRQNGFTLVETLLVLSLFLFLITTAAVSYAHWIKKYRLTIAVNTVVDALAFARHSAIILHADIVFSPLGSSWESGQQIVDSVHSRVLRVLPKLPDSLRMRWRGSFGNDESLRYRPDGFTDGQQGNFEICLSQTVCAHIIVIESGRVRVVY